ncbi:hypothetical protein ACFIQF_22680 [Comamonas sp. J-3]|uniref:hypothetical protein n=1 Tax=Comamonas trifloxystrobinivorans TaxID=3350256 RepID=UPI0037295BBB
MTRFVLPTCRIVDGFANGESMLAALEEAGIFQLRWDKAMELFRIADVCDCESAAYADADDLLALADELRSMALEHKRKALLIAEIIGD